MIFVFNKFILLKISFIFLEIFKFYNISFILMLKNKKVVIKIILNNLYEISILFLKKLSNFFYYSCQECRKLEFCCQNI